MSLAIVSPNRDVTSWIRILKNEAPDISFQVYPEITQPEKVKAAMVWQHPQGALKDFKNLELICSMGAGVDHILADDSIDKSIPISRIVDPKLTFSMTNYVLMGVLNFHRQMERYQKDKARKVWDMSNPEIPLHVGVLGVGELGGDVLDKLSYIGFKVSGYGNSPKETFRHPYYYGEELEVFLSQVNVLICLLPLTSKTENILNIDLFKKCRKGTYLINVARGRHLVEEDLPLAIDKGYLSGALLDVFRKEPLPKDHPFWLHPKISITPHIASITNPDAAMPQIIENYRNLIGNQPINNLISRSKGY